MNSATGTWLVEEPCAPRSARCQQSHVKNLCLRSPGRRMQRLSHGLPDRLVRRVLVGDRGPPHFRDESSQPQQQRKRFVELPQPPTEFASLQDELSKEYYPKDSEEARNRIAGTDQQIDLGASKDKGLTQTPAEKNGFLGPEVMREVLSVAVPALGTVLADPLMSLVDTACVGQLSSVELAALGPNTAIFNFVFQLFTFLALSTANTIASHSIQSPGLSDQEREHRRNFSEKIMCFSITIAAVIGTASAVSLFVAGPTLLKALGSNPEIIPFALPYLRIRALASPAVMVTMAAQGACLGQQDMWTPLKVVLIGGLVNLVGDMYLILNLKMGTVGAALATTGAQYAGALFFIWYLVKGGNKGKGLKLRWMGMPTMEVLKPMLELGRVLLARTGVTMAGYTALTSAATLLGTLAVAAHQVTLQVFWLLTYFPEPFSLTAQTLIARDISNRKRVVGMSRLLLKMGAITGAVLAITFVGILLGLPKLFSSDVAVIATFQRLIPQATICLCFCALSLMFEGISIGAGETEHLPMTLGVSSFAMIGWVYVSQLMGHGLGSVWWGLVAFFSLRVVGHLVQIQRTWKTSPFGMFQRREEKDEPRQEDVNLDPVMNPQLA
ncbi:hypothetical protein BSKO_03561 [Bryopsis sp. KO-2023]|nr:hypothetical protein BSKO_03561 [Bryopsis sp. KO-2023]